MSTSYLTKYGYGIYITQSQAAEYMENIINSLEENDPKKTSYVYDPESPYFEGMIEDQYEGLLNVEIHGNLEWDEHDYVVFAKSTTNLSYDFDKLIIELKEPSLEETVALNNLSLTFAEALKENYYIASYVG
jgi:hypothetical protein